MKYDDYQLAIEWILESKFTVIFTGAGVSVESGIPPFRGENGLWKKYDPAFLMTSYFEKYPEKSWKLIKEIFYDFFRKAKPNNAHYVITELENKGLIDVIITQNIDNLHQRAGSSNVIEFHGTSRTLTCINCFHNFDCEKFLNSIPPNCPKCGGLLKPDFVFFNEPIPPEVHNLSNKYALMSNLFILVGTTGEIIPASIIPYFAKEARARIIEINIKPTQYTHKIVDIFLQGKATVVFSRLRELLVNSGHV